MRTGVILVGGKSSRMGFDKCLTILNGKPLISFIVSRLRPVVDETIIVVSNKSQREAYIGFADKIIIDAFPSDTPIVGAYTGFNEARGEYALLSGGDQPLIDSRVVELLFKEAEGCDAATPVWPNGWVEPLQSVYRAKPAAEVALQLINTRRKRLRLLLDTLQKVKYIPIDEIRKVDPDLLTLTDVDTQEDLERVRHIIEGK